MIKKPLYYLLAAATCLSFPMITKAGLSMPLSPDNVMGFYLEGSALQTITDGESTPSATLSEIEAMLHQKDTALPEPVINRVLTTIKCADKYHVNHNNILTIIDYSLPSSVKRLWVFDMATKKLLFHTYVSHGIKSGVLLSDYFSNKFNSKASSMGLYKTDKVYYGRHGLSLKLAGLEHGFNDNASNRSVVMHGGWYVEDAFIKKYGRAGRSWGCPAVPDHLTSSIINTIKDDALLVVYYPNENWLLSSKYQRCDQPTAAVKQVGVVTKPVNEVRDMILFADLRKNNQLNDNDPIVVMPADTYTSIFHTAAPVDRMLRRQISDKEYIAVSNDELKRMITPDDKNTQHNLSALSFVVPVLHMIHGYYETNMKLINLGSITTITFNTDGYTMHSDKQSEITLKTTNQFIRWVGL
jgi:hypothetical protein